MYAFHIFVYSNYRHYLPACSMDYLILLWYAEWICLNISSAVNHHAALHLCVSLLILMVLLLITIEYKLIKHTSNYLHWIVSFSEISNYVPLLLLPIYPFQTNDFVTSFWFRWSPQIWNWDLGFRNLQSIGNHWQDDESYLTREKKLDTWKDKDSMKWAKVKNRLDHHHHFLYTWKQ